MATLTRRVQILLSRQQHERLEALARARDVSVGELIRRAVEETYVAATPDERVDAVKRMAALRLPVADWEQMERESVGDDPLG